MRWRSAPTRGERYIVFNPTTGEVVVAAEGLDGSTLHVALKPVVHDAKEGL